MIKPLRVLLIEGSAEDAERLVRELEGAGFDVTFERVDTAEGLKAALDKEAWDIIVSSYTLPRFTGTEALRIHLERGLEAPFIFVSGSMGEEAAVAAMKAGAHDCIMKGNLQRFVPAVERALREAEGRRNHNEAVEALKKSETLYQSLVEMLPVHIFRKDEEGRFTFGNDLFCRAMGKTLPEILGKTDADYFPPDLAGKYRRNDQAVMSGGKVWEDVEQYQTPEGERKYVHVLKVPLRDHAGKLIGIQGMSWDVTEQKRAEAALAESETRFRSLAETSPAAILIHQGGPFRYVNELMEQLTGYGRQELLRMNFWEVIHPDHQALVRERGQARRRGEAIPLQYEFKILTQSGQTRWVELRAKATEFEGQPAVLATMFDVTERKRAEEALRQSEELFSKAFRALSVGISIARLSDGQFLEANDAFLKLFGFRREEVIGHTALELGLWTDSQQRQEAVVRLRTEGSLKNAEAKSRKKSGELGDMLLSMELVELGGEKCILGLFTDITERKQAEELATQFGTILDNSSNEIFIFEASSLRFTQVSLGARQNLGYTMKELTALTPLDLKPDFTPEQFAALIEPLRTGERDRLLFETRQRRKDGTFYPVEVRLQMSRSKNAPVFLAILQDITERKQADERIRQQASLLDLAQDAIIVRDLEGRIQFWNKATERLSGWTAEEVIGRKVTELVYTDPTQFEAAQKQLREKGEWAGELHLVAKGGREVTVYSRWTLVRDEQGNPKTLLAINTDITDKKRLESQFLRAQRMEGLGLLAAGIAHDLNNILAPILMASELMREKGVDAKEIPKMLTMIHVNAQRGADIIKQLLTFGRGAVGQRIIVQPRHLVKDMVKMAQETFPKNILIHSQTAEDLWTVIGDATQIHQVLLNLCLNARDAMPGGGTLTVTAENIVLGERYAAQNLEAAPGAYVLFKVSDSGTGIAPEVINKIFDPFFTTKEVGKGTGLGLSTVLGIAKSHNGFVKVYSEPGQGSTFTVYLPAAPGSVAEEQGPRAAAMPGGQGELILVVDDEEPILELTRKMLERHGYTALTARDGTEALALFAQWRGKIRVVLTDVSMPVMDGLALVRILRKMEPGINIIAASGRGSGGKASELKTLGIHKFLTKPYAAEKLMRALQEVLPRKQP